MNPSDIIAIAFILVIVGLATFYIIRAKRRGQRCIGCPDSSTCSGNCASCHGGCPHSAHVEAEADDTCPEAGDTCPHCSKDKSEEAEADSRSDSEAVRAEASTPCPHCSSRSDINEGLGG